MITWLMNLIKLSLSTSMHHFSIDFGSALLANIIHAQVTLQKLSQEAVFAQQLMETMLKLLR